MIVKYFLLSLLIPFVSCREYQAVETLDLESYMGKWYQVYEDNLLISTPSGRTGDMSGTEIILKTAGGEITNIHYEELEYGDLNYEQGGIIVASSNKLMHKKICYEIKKIIKENDLYPL